MVENISSNQYKLQKREKSKYILTREQILNLLETNFEKISDVFQEPLDVIMEIYPSEEYGEQMTGMAGFESMSIRVDELEECVQDLQKRLVQILPMTLEILDTTYEFSIWIEKEGKIYVALIPDLDIASQGNTIVDAFENLKELTKFYFEGEDKRWVKKKLKNIKTK